SSVTPAAHLSRLGQHGESCVRNRVRQSRTLGSVRGGDSAATVTPIRARSRKRRIHAKGQPTAATGPLLLGNTTLTILRDKFEDLREARASAYVPPRASCDAEGLCGARLGCRPVTAAS